MSNKEFVEIPGLQRITKKLLQEFCKKDSLYQTPHLNDRLYLHFKGFQSIENLEEYTGLKCLWLESNAISEIQGLENQTELRSLFLHNNLIQKIENLHSCKLLDTLNLSSNHITKIENCGFNVLPVLSTLNLSRNYLRTSEALQELVACKNLHCLDLSQNRIDDILVVKIFAKMPELRVLILQGNPVVSRIPQYRKTMILECKKLTFLDNFPVSPKDRACAAAWKRGGFEEEQNELKRWGKKDRRKMRRDINATLILRKEKGAEDIHLLESTDEEEDYNQPKRSKQKFEITAPLDVEIPGINLSESTNDSLNEAKEDSHTEDSSNSAENSSSTSSAVFSSSETSSTKESENLEKAFSNELPSLTKNEGVTSTKHGEGQDPSSTLSNEEDYQKVVSVKTTSEKAFHAAEGFDEKNIDDLESRKESLNEAKKESSAENFSNSAENSSSTSSTEESENLEKASIYEQNELTSLTSDKNEEDQGPSSNLSNAEKNQLVNQQVDAVESTFDETFPAEGVLDEKNINDSESREESLNEAKKKSHIKDSSHSAENSSPNSTTKEAEHLEKASRDDHNELPLLTSDNNEGVVSTKHEEDQGPSSILTNEEENQQVASVESTSEETFTAKGALNEKSINDKESRKESPLNEAKKESHIEDSSYSAENSSLASSTEESENLEKASRDDHNGLTSLTLEKNERVISTNYDQDQGPSATLSNGEKNELVYQQVHSVLNASEETFPAEGALNEKNIPAKDETETSLEKKPTEGETEVISEKKPSEGQTEAEVILERLLEPIFDAPPMEETEDEDEYEVEVKDTNTNKIMEESTKNIEDFEEPLCFANFKKEQSLLLGNVETVQIYSTGNHLKVPLLEDNEETVLQGDEDQGPSSTLSNEKKNKLVYPQVDSVLNASEETFAAEGALDEKNIPVKVPSKKISPFSDLERSNDETDGELDKEDSMVSLQSCPETKFRSSESEKEFKDERTLETEVVLQESKEVNGEFDISLTSSESVPAQFNTFTVSEPTTSSQVTLSTSLSSEPNNSTFDIKESNTCSSDSTGVIEYDIKEYEELKKSILLESQPQQVLNINYQLSESNFADTELSFEEFENEEIKENIKISKEKAKQYIQEKICQNVEKLEYTESDLELYFKNVDTSIKKESNNSSLESKDFEDSNSGSKSEEHLSQEKSEEENDTPRKSPAWFNTFLKGLMNLKECEKDPLLEDDSDCPQNDGLTKCSAENVPQTSSPKENQNDSCGNVSLKKNVTKSEKTKIEDEDFDKTKEETDPSKEVFTEKPTKNSFWANRDFRSEDKTASDWLENYLNEMKDEKEETIQNEDITHEQTSPKTKCSKGTSVVSWLETNIGNKELYLIKELKDKASQKSDESTPKSNMEDYGIATDVDDEEKDSKQEEEEDPCEDLLTELEKFPKKGETKKIEIEVGIERSEHKIFEEVNKNIKDFKKRKDDLEKLVNSMNSKQDPSVLLENMKAVLNTSTESYVKAPPLEDRQKAEFKGEEMNQASSSKTKQSSKTVGLLKEGEILDEPSKGTESSEKEAEVEPIKREESIKGNSEDKEQALNWSETKLARKEASKTPKITNEDNPTGVGQCQKAPLEKNLPEDETETSLEKKPTEDQTEEKVILETILEQSRSYKYPISDVQAEDETESLEKKPHDDETEVLSEKKPSEDQTEAEVILESVLEPIFDVPPLEETEDEDEYEVEVKDTNPNKIIEEITKDIEDFKSLNADFEEPISSANFKEEQSYLLGNVETVENTSSENYVKIPPLEDSEETVLQRDEINQMGRSEIKQSSKTVGLLEEGEIVEECNEDTESSGVELFKREENSKGNREDEEQVLSWWDTTLAAARKEASETSATANEDNPTSDGQCQKVPLEKSSSEDETETELEKKPSEDQTEAEVILESILEQSRSKEYPISDLQPLEETKDETTITSFENNRQPLREVLSTFNEVVEKIPNRDKQKSKILKNLIENPLTKSISAQTGDEINRQFDEMNRERRQRLSQMIDQVYSQKDKYDDTLEVVDGRLMIVERSTGALLSVPPPPPSRTAGSTEYTCCGLSTTQTSCNDDSNSDDYGTALSENDDVDDIEQHASDTKIKKILLHKHQPPQMSEEGANESLALSSSGSCCTKMKREENENSHRDDTHQQFHSKRRVVKLHQEIDAEVPPSEVSQWLVGEDKTSVRVTVDDNRIVLAKRTSSDKEEIMLMGKFSAAIESGSGEEGGGKEYVSELQVELGNSTQTFMDLGEAALEDIALIFELPHNGQ